MKIFKKGLTGIFSLCAVSLAGCDSISDTLDMKAQIALDQAGYENVSVSDIRYTGWQNDIVSKTEIVYMFYWVRPITTQDTNAQDNYTRVIMQCSKKKGTTDVNATCSIASVSPKGPSRGR